MKMTYETFVKHAKQPAQIREIEPSLLKIRKKVRLFQAKEEGVLCAVVALSQKSRVLLKDVAVLESIVEKMALYGGYDFRAKLLLLEAPICSKAQNALESQGWEIR